MSETSIQEEETNPFLELIRQHANDPSPFDRSPKPTHSEKNKQLASEEVIPLTLSARQSSYAMLHANLTTKDNEETDAFKGLETTNDPVMIFGKNNQAEQRISLSARQPSYVSLTDNIPKGSDGNTDFEPIIEEAVPTTLTEISESFEEEDDPQVKFVMELKAKNANRWKAMGYEPPKDLIPLVRSSTHSVYSPERATSGNILEETPTPTGRRRSGSFGMLPGQAETDEGRMAGILSSCRQSEASTHKGEEEEEYIEYEELPGRLGELVEPDTDVFRALYGELPSQKRKRMQVKIDLEKLHTKCADLLWVDEVDYIREVLEQFVTSPKATSKSTPVKTQPQKIVSNVDKLESEKEAAINQNFHEYEEQARLLDEKYSKPELVELAFKPTPELLDLKAMTRAMLRVNQIDEARRMTKRIAEMEKNISQNTIKELKRKYHNEDYQLKLTYAKRQVAITERYDYLIEQEHNRIRDIKQRHKDAERHRNYTSPRSERKSRTRISGSPLSERE